MPSDLRSLGDNTAVAAFFLAPPVGIMLFGFGYAIRYGKKRDRENEADLN